MLCLSTKFKVSVVFNEIIRKIFTDTCLLSHLTSFIQKSSVILKIVISSYYNIFIELKHKTRQRPRGSHYSNQNIIETLMYVVNTRRYIWIGLIKQLMNQNNISYIYLH